MTPLKALRLVAILLGIFVLAFALSDGYYRANAEEQRVFVDPSIKGSAQVRDRIESRLLPDDEILVRIGPDGYNFTDPGWVKITLLAEGNEVTAYGNDWVPQVYLDERLDRVDNVTRRSVDQIVRMIDEIHRYQEDNPKPERKELPPPTVEQVPVQGPPVPQEPVSQETPLLFRTYVWGPLAGFVALFFTWSILHTRRNRRLRRLREISSRAEQQADWGADDYGIKMTID